MGSWTPKIIQGGKTDDSPAMDADAEAFLQAFIRAGLEEEKYRHISFLTEETWDSSSPVSHGDLPKAVFGFDEFGSPVIRFT